MFTLGLARGLLVRMFVRPREREWRIGMGPSISVFGLGYVGTVTATCLAHKGHNVIGVDLNRTKVEAMQAGRSPVVEARVGILAPSAMPQDACMPLRIRNMPS